MSLPWSSKGSKATPVNADELMIIDSEDAVLSTKNKRITLGSLPALEAFTWTADHDADGFDLLNVGGITISNPADTFQYIVTPGAIAADRIANLPVLTGTDTFVFESQSQTFLNKLLDDFSNDVHANTVHIQVRNETGGTLDKGEVVYISGFSVGNNLPLISLADASSSATMPAIGIITDDILDVTNGDVTIGGILDGISTSGLTTGGTIYVSETAGEFTDVKPIGTALIQNIGTVLKVGGIGAGVIKVTSMDRTNDLPNIASANFWVGNASGVPTAVILSNDATMDNTGALTIANNAITDAKTDTFTTTKISTLSKSLLNSAIVYNDQTNTFGSALKQTFTHAAGGAGIGLAAIAGDVTAPNNGEFWYNLTSNKFRARENGVTVDMIDDGQTPWTSDIDAAGFDLLNVGGITISNPADTFQYILTPAAIVADRILNLPLMTGTDTITLNDFAATLTNKTLTTPTIASFTNATHNHQAAVGGGTLNSTLALSDTANIAYLNTANVYTAGVRQDFLGLLAGTSGLNVGGIAGNPTTQVNGDIWLNTSTNQGFMRINGINVDIGAAAAGAPPFADTTSIVEGSVDPTKEIRFEVDGLTTATTRVITPPDADITLVNTSDGLIVDAQTGTFTTTKISTTNKALLNSAIVYNDQTNTFGDFAQIFPDNQLFIQNPAATFTFQLSAPGIVANRTLTFPLLTGNDIFVTEAFAQTLTNKTIDLTDNTVTGTTAEFNTALSDNDFATLAGTETLTNKTLTEPKFADLGFIADANGNEMISFDTVTTAVNYLQLANSATVTALSLSSLGTDTNIDCRFIPKGTGTFYGVRETWAWPLTDETTAPSTGVKYTTEPAPYDMTLEDIIGGLTTAGTGAALFTMEILKENSVNADAFTTILSTKVTIDASEFTSTTAATAPVLSVTTWEKGRRLQLEIDTLDTNGLARGAKIELLTHATAK